MSFKMLPSLVLLLIASSICAWAQSAADYYVQSLPGQPDGPLLKMHAGQIEVDPEHNGHLFFWHYQNRHIANRQRTVLWLNGGPGCSSMDGAMMEIGPYRVTGDNLEYNNGSWDEFANLLFVDQPVGTGFSYVNTNSYIHDLPIMAEHMVTFLEKWFRLFPEYETDDIYIGGESYAGQFIPYLARAILERNQKLGTPQGTPWNLRGLLIGNGWISPIDQYPSYLQFAYKEGLIQKGSEVAGQLEALQKTCFALLSAEGARNRVDIPECERILSELLTSTTTSDKQCLNMYDVRLRDESCGRMWPPDLASMTPYLRRPEVAKALNVGPDKATGWEECSGSVGLNFRATNSVPAVQYLPEIMESGVAILLFSGDKDLICNHLGTEQLIHNMKWNDGTGFETSPGIWAPRRYWTFEDEPAGYYQQARNLTYVVFYNASHMVPFDYPRRTRDMLDRFMRVDIANIGGPPTDSRLDGEKLPPTSVGGHPNSTVAQEEEDEKVKEAEWKAYAKSGEAVLVVVIIGVTVWGFFIWRSRRRHQGYRSVYRDDGSPGGSSSILNRFRRKNRGPHGDIEATDFDEAELDRLDRSRDTETEHYAISGDETDDETPSRGNHPS